MKFLNFVDNLKYGFSIKYPSTWEKKEKLKDIIVVFLAPLENESDKFRENLSLMISNLFTQTIDLYDYVNFSIDQLREAILDFRLFEKTQTKIAKIPAYKIVYSGKRKQLNIKIMQYYAIKKNKVYLITYTAKKDKFELYFKIIKKIIKSFSFL